MVRHASFRGLRDDKPAARDHPRGAARSRKARAETGTSSLTHPDRVYWPDAGVSKQGLADYYAQVWPRMAPHLVNRPVALLRCPGGIEGQCFFQKHAWKGLSRDILTFHDPLDDADEEPLVAVDGLPGLIGLVQGGALEIHTWQSTLDDLEHPDQIVIDLDPGEGVDWPAMIAAAREVRDRLEALGLAAFVKTSGGKGLHVVAPLKPAAGWPAVKAFAAASPRPWPPTPPTATSPPSPRPSAPAASWSTTCATAATTPPSRPTPPAPAPARPSRCRSPGTSSARPSGPAHFTVANAAGARGRPRPIPGPTSAPPRGRSPR